MMLKRSGHMSPLFLFSIIKGNAFNGSLSSVMCDVVDSLSAERNSFLSMNC